MLGSQLSPSRIAKMSTVDLKRSLEKIKQTQLDVLKVLRGDSSSIGSRQSRANGQHFKQQRDWKHETSVPHLNLLKMSEISNMRKEFERQRQRSSIKIESLHSQIKLLKAQINEKYRAQTSWKREKEHLGFEIESLQSQLKRQNERSGEQMRKMQLQTLTQEINKLTIEKKNIEEAYQHLEKESKIYRTHIQKLNEENEKIVQRLNSRNVQNIGQANEDENNLISHKITNQIRKISQIHQQMYQSFKNHAKITVIDMDHEEQLQQSISNVIKMIKTLNQNQQQIRSHQSDSQNDNSDSFRIVDSDLKRGIIEIQRLEHENYDLLNQIAELKQKIHKLQLKNKELVKQRQPHEKNNNQNISLEFEDQMKKINSQKASLNQIALKIGQSVIKTSNQNVLTQKQEVANLIILNSQKNGETTQLKSIIQSLTIENESLKSEKIRFDSIINFKQSLFEKQVQQTVYLVNQLKRMEIIIKDYTSKMIYQQKKIEELTIKFATIQKVKQQTMITQQTQIETLRNQINKNMQHTREAKDRQKAIQSLQIENASLKRLLLTINPAVIRLWSSKQAQYQRIHNLLAKIKEI